MKKPTILVVDDDPHGTAQLVNRFARFGFDAVSCLDGVEALEQVRALEPCVVLIESHPVEGDGLEVCRRLRVARYCGTILVHSAHDSIIDILLAHEAGADDHVSKSTDLELLDAKIRRALRRSRDCIQCQRLASSPSAEVAPEAPNADPRLLLPDDHHLTRLEEQLLAELLAAGSGLVPTQSLLYSGWGRRGRSARLLYDVISRLRTKLEPLGWMIHSVRGHGYRLERQEQSPALPVPPATPMPALPSRVQMCKAVAGGG